MNFLKIWWEISQFAAADQQMNRQSNLVSHSPPSLSVTEDGEISFLSTTFLLPLTVGLSTVVASVLLGCRNRSCIDTKMTIQNTATLYPHRDHHSYSTLNSSSSSVKRKSGQGKPNSHLSGSSLGLVLHLEQPEGAAPTSTPIHRPPPSPVDNQTSSPGNQQQSSTGKKSKKRSSKSRHSNVVVSFVDDGSMGRSIARNGEVNDHDESWVTVNPKRAFKPISHQPIKKSKPDEHTSPTKQWNRAEGPSSRPVVCTSATSTVSTGETPLSVCTSLLSSSTTSSCTTSPSYLSDATLKLRSTATDDQQRSVDSGQLDIAVTTSSPSERVVDTTQNKISVTSSSPLPRLQVVGTLSTNTSELDHPTVSLASHETPETRGLTSNASILHSQHLSAQVQAKELECRVLREEVIRLRDEIKSARLSTVTSPRMHDVEIMTDAAPHDQVDAQVPGAVNDTELKPAPTPAACPPTPPDRSGEVLLATLQAEIKRLAKEVTLSHQRNENLEFRLASATKQLSEAATKSVPMDTWQASQQELAGQIEATRAAEARCAEAERQSVDLQHLLETKSGQWENSYADLMKKLQDTEKDSASLLATNNQLQRNNTTLLENKEHLRQEYECLLSKHKVAESELRRVEELVAELRQNCLSTCEGYANTVEEHKHMAEELKRQLSESQDAVRQRTQEVGLLQDQLASRQLELDELQKVVAAEQASREPVATHQPPTPLVDVVVSQMTVSQLTAAECDTDFAATTGRPDAKDVEQHYHQALDCTEAMLSRLQASVDEEEQRWRKALDASVAECQLLTTKVDHLEASLATVMEERDTLAKSLQQLQSRSEAADGDSHSVRSTSAYSSISLPRFALDSVAGTDLSPDTPRDELIAYIGKLRHLVRIEHNALKREQSKSAHLEAELKTNCGFGALPSAHRNGASLNGGAGDMNVNSELKSPLGCGTENVNHLPTNGSSGSHFAQTDTELDVRETTKAGDDVAGDNSQDVVDGLLSTALAATTSDLHHTETAI